MNHCDLHQINILAVSKKKKKLVVQKFYVYMDNCKNI